MFRLFLSGILVLTLLQGCIVYRIDVQQGNDLSAKQLAGLEIGMNREEVRALLGTPLVDDPFRENRWDYVYAFKAGKSKEVVRRRISLFFEEDRLSRIDGSLDDETVRARDLDLEELDEARDEVSRSEDAPDTDEPGFWDRVSAALRKNESTQ
jgi:outer membrane protein assembly factor BamE